MAVRCDTGEIEVSIPTELEILSQSAERASMSIDEDEVTRRELREEQGKRKTEIEGTFQLIKQASKVGIHDISISTTF